MKKLGFTLTEVLITLTILGIIAVLVIPNAYEKYQRRVTITKVKKMYSMLSNAYEQYLVENKNLPVFDSQNEKDTKGLFDVLIRPYFQISYDAGIDVNKKIKIMGNNPVKKIDGTLNNSGFSDKNYYTNNGEGFLYYAVMLKDGSVIFLRGFANNNTSIPIVFYDINGKKGPNTFGKDLFVFHYLEDRLGSGNASETDLKKIFENGCIKSGTSGVGCLAWIIAKGNMDYLDCPDTIIWETGKCK